MRLPWRSVCRLSVEAARYGSSRNALAETYMNAEEEMAREAVGEEGTGSFGTRGEGDPSRW